MMGPVVRGAPRPPVEASAGAKGDRMGAVAASEVVHVISADGTAIGLWRTGSGPSLIAVHGSAADHTAWDRVVPLLASDFTVYAMDRRGRGASGDAPTYSLEREIEDVVAAVEAVPAPISLYGHSFGATPAIEAAARTSRLAHLVLYEGGLKPAGVRHFPDELIERLDELLEAGADEEALSLFMRTAAGLSEDELELLRRQPAWRARVAAVRTIPRELRASNDYGSEPARLASISVPVMLLVGELSTTRRRDAFTSLAGLLHPARVAVLAGQRHAAHQTDPGGFAGVLREFLSDASPAR